MYLKVLASILVVLAAVRVIGGVLGSRKLIKLSVVGSILLVTVAALNWILMDLSPVPKWLVKLAAKYLHF